MRVIDFAHAYPLQYACDAGYLYGLTVRSTRRGARVPARSPLTCTCTYARRAPLAPTASTPQVAAAPRLTAGARPISDRPRQNLIYLMIELLHTDRLQSHPPLLASPATAPTAAAADGVASEEAEARGAEWQRRVSANRSAQPQACSTATATSLEASQVAPPSPKVPSPKVQLPKALSPKVTLTVRVDEPPSSRGVAQAHPPIPTAQDLFELPPPIAPTGVTPAVSGLPTALNLPLASGGGGSSLGGGGGGSSLAGAWNDALVSTANLCAGAREIHPVDLALRPGEVGCRWQTADGADAPEAVTAARADRVRMHADEFLEAFAHSHLGKWAGDWLGFAADLSLLPSLRRVAPSSPSSPLHVTAEPSSHVAAPPPPCAHVPRPSNLKRLVFRRPLASYVRPRSLCLRITSRPDARPTDPILAARLRARVDVVLCGDVTAETPLAPQHPPAAAADAAASPRGEASQMHLDGYAAGDALDLDGRRAMSAPGDGRRLSAALEELLSGLPAPEGEALRDAFCKQLCQLTDDLENGSYFQFGSASLWCTFEARAPAGRPPAGLGLDDASSGDQPKLSADGGAGFAPSVRLSHFAGLEMHREAGYHPSFLSALIALERGVRTAPIGWLGGDASGQRDEPMEEEAIHMMSDEE